MLQFATPLGLLTLGALLVPILIHLVRRPLRVVRVGSLRFLQADHRQVHSLRWHEWLLLALRCATLALLALSLAGVRWQPHAPAPARWLLTVPGAKLDGAVSAEWNRLRDEGFEARVLAPGFPEVDSTHVSADSPIDAWSLLREADLRLPFGSRVVVFGPTWATQFRGSRPTLSNVEVSWRPVQGEPPAISAAVPARVGMVAALDREDDARFVRAMFAAIGARIVTDDSPEWMFQLGDVALPAMWNERVQRGARLVTDAPNTARMVSVTRWFDAGARRVRLRQRVALETGVAVLRDSADEPFYTEERRGAGVHWRFALRFHPDWTDWPLESAFPEWWRTQFRSLGGGPASARAADDAEVVPPTDVSNPGTISPEQAAPGFSPKQSPAVSPLAGFGRVDLRGGCWLLAAMLFVTERALSLSAQRRRTSA